MALLTIRLRSRRNQRCAGDVPRDAFDYLLRNVQDPDTLPLRSIPPADPPLVRYRGGPHRVQVTIELPPPVAPALRCHSLLGRLLGLVILLTGPSALVASCSPAKAAPTAGTTASLLDEMRAIQAVLAERTRVAEDVGAFNDGRRQAEKTDCRHTKGLCRIAPDVTLAQRSMRQHELG